MTKNNLNNCLSWLLQHPHSYGNLDHITVSADTAIGSYDESVAAEEDEMARLQLAPQINHRPRLHTQAISEPNPLPTPAPSRPSEESKPPLAQPKQKLPTPSISRQAPEPQTPGIFSDGVFDIDEIDLTGDVTTTSFGDFGPPTRLWREDSASRVEPLPKKKGKKRKSDEYESDLLSPRSSHKTTRVLQRTATTFSPLRTSQSDVYSRHVQNEVSLTQTTIRPNAPVSLPEDDFPGFSVSDYDEVPGHLDVEAHDDQHRRTPIKKSQTPRRSNVILDSDDDEDQEFVSKLESSPPKSITGSRQASREHIGQGTSVEEIFRSPTRPQPLKSSSSSRKPEFPSIAEVPTYLASSTQDPGFKSSAGSAASAENLRPDQKRLVESFAIKGQGQLQSLLQRLEQSKKEVDDKIMHEICELGGASMESKERLKAIGNKITSATRLREDFATLAKLRTQREQMVVQRDELRRSGHSVNPDDPEDILTSLCSRIFQAKREIDVREASVFTLLDQVGVSSSGSASQHVHSPRPTMSAQKVLVASTQKPPPPTSRYIKDEDPQGLSHLSTQSVRQTPAHNRFDMPGMSIKSSNRSPSPMRHLSARPGVINRERSPLPAVTGASANVPSRSFISNAPESSARDFSRTMASPTRDYGFDEDDFGDDLDDEEMYQAVEEFEQNLSSRTAESPDSRGRAVLAEVSDNVRRVSPKKKASSQPPASHSALMQHPWSKDVASALTKRFHLHGFRHNQLEAINATLDGKDTFVLMPTGGGKSLCYQLPAIVHSGRTRGVTIVVSPLLSLMQDQVDHLQRLRIQAFLINGNSSKAEREDIMGILKGPQPEGLIQLLYVTPEMLNNSQAVVAAFRDLNKKKRLARIVIDEAHCVSQWGHDFRPDYKALGEIRKKFNDVPVMALTATATENVKIDVMHNLGMKNAEVFIQSFNRPNLTYAIRRKGKNVEVLEEIAEIIRTSYRGQAGVVYCLSRANCEAVAEQLTAQFNIQAQHYHAGMPSDERINIQKKWQAGEFKVIVATIAFGMGIDKADVRFVMHHSIPKSLEGYYQETGRAGRDGKRSGCYLFYGYRDTMLLKQMIGKSEGSNEQKERQYQLLRNMVQFCENRSDCRRVQVLGYFNEHFQKQDCRNGCDNCNSTSTFETQDFSEHARAAISIVKQIHRTKVTVLQCVDIYRGGRSKKITQHEHDSLPEYGKGANLVRGDVERLFHRLVSEKALAEYNVLKGGFATQYIKPGPAARDFEAGRRSLKIQVLASPHEKARTSAPAAKKSRKKAQGTGVKAVADDYPASTNVSSPLQPRTNRKQPRHVQEEDSDDEDFIVHTSQMDQDQGDDAFDEDLELEHPKTRNASRLGPPITADATTTLNTTHQHILNDFIEKARAQIERIAMMKNLRQKHITDSTLRKIGLEFPQTMTELQKKSGMNDEILKMFGPVLLRLIKDAYNNYEALMRAQEDRPDDPNHKTVIEIVDDDTNGEDDAESEMNIDDVDEAESSHYFSVCDDISQSDGRGKICQPAEPLSMLIRSSHAALVLRDQISQHHRKEGNLRFQVRVFKSTWVLGSAARWRQLQSKSGRHKRQAKQWRSRKEGKEQL